MRKADISGGVAGGVKAVGLRVAVTGPKGGRPRVQVKTDPRGASLTIGRREVGTAGDLRAAVATKSERRAVRKAARAAGFPGLARSLSV